ncbi:MAG: hypothetical protein AB7E32_10105 [Desulfovibrio sp.]
MRFSGLLGICFSLIAILGNLLLYEELSAFIYLPALAFCIFLTLGLSYLSYGALDSLRALSALRLLLLGSHGLENSARRAEVLAGNVTHMYAAGIAGTLIGLLKMLHHASLTTPPDWSLASNVVILLPLFYALCISELLLRPGARRLAGLAGPDGRETEEF